MNVTAGSIRRRRRWGWPVPAGRSSAAQAWRPVPLPPVGEPEDVLVQRHHIERCPLLESPAKRRVFADVLPESERAQAISKRGIFRIRGDFGNRIHIERGS